MHLIGHLQTNKARDAVRLFSVVHAVDSERLLDALQVQAARSGAIVTVLVEVNVSGEVGKHGVAPDATESLVVHAAGLPHLRLRGLMTVAPLVDDRRTSDRSFAPCAELRDRLADAHPDWQLPDLSMGMSNDYEVAITEGATLVRIGRAIFGP